jgi:hypothetical protein
LFCKFQGVLKHWQCFFQVNDVDFVAMTENKWGHLWGPEARLVTKMATGFQHLTHRY